MIEQYPISTNPEEVAKIAQEGAIREPMVIALSDYGLDGQLLVTTFHKGGRIISRTPTELTIENDAATNNRNE